MMNLTTSQLNMWRSLIALAHSDGELHFNEVGYLSDVFKELNLSETQVDILNRDMDKSPNIEETYSLISLEKDRAKFFYLARILCWLDGDYSKKEVEVIEKLQEVHLTDLESDKMVSNLGETVFRSFQKEKAEHSRKGISLDKVVIEAVEHWDNHEEVKSAA